MNNLNITKALIDKQTNANMLDKLGNVPAYYAVHCQNLEVVKTILKA